MIGGDWLPYLSARFTRAFCACFRASGSERFSQQQPWLPQGLAAATVPGIFSADGMAYSGLALFESLSYRTFSVGENGFTWAGSRFDRPEPEPEPKHRELRLLLQLPGGFAETSRHRPGRADRTGPRARETVRETALVSLSHRRQLDVIFPL